MKIEEAVKKRAEEIRRIAERHGAMNIRLFGSFARGEANPESDVDLLVDIGTAAQTSSWFPIGLILELEELLGRRVEVVTERSLNKDLRERVLREAVPL